METYLKIFLNRFFLVILCVGITALTSSFLAVQAFDLNPCFLCNLQRGLFAVLVGNALFGLVGPLKEGFFRIIIACLGFGVLLGVIHFSMQLGMLPDFCISERGFNTPDEFLKSLQTPKCSQVNWSILGVPLSLINAILHASILGVSIRLKSKKNLIKSLS